jgi:hypothetical protein
MAWIGKQSRGILAVVVLGVVLGACGRDEHDVGDEAARHDDMPAMNGMHMDAGAMERHAAESRAMAERMRAHVREMRALPPAEWHDHVEHHTGEVAALLSMMSRHMREMDMGMDMDDAHMGEMMGMSGDEHRRMMDDMEALREETETLQTASASEVQRRMPAHLDRLERMVQMMEEAGEHMGAGHGH